MTYYGEIILINPESAVAGGSVTITGRAVERTTGTPMANVPLKLYLTVRGFERKYDVVTGTTGTFTYTFQPGQTDAGQYDVRAVHPDITDRHVGKV